MTINNLTGALQNAVSGLNATGVRTAVTANNVANALTPGYSRETANLASLATGGVTVASVTRAGDPFSLPQILAAAGAGGQADAEAAILNQLGGTLGTVVPGAPLPDDVSRLETDFVQLTANPSGAPEQQAVIADANQFAGDLHSTTQSVQQLRGQADQSIAAAVAQANQDLGQLASLNELAGPGVAPALFDQQDTALKDLAKQLGITFNRSANGQVQVFTQSGQPLLLGQSQAQLGFNPAGIVTTNDAYVAPGAAPGPGQVAN
jgi:flagellar hook-associated protein 1 FlgK